MDTVIESKCFYLTLSSRQHPCRRRPLGVLINKIRIDGVPECLLDLHMHEGAFSAQHYLFTECKSNRL